MNNEKPTKEFLLKNIRRYSWGTCIKKDYPEFYDFVKNKYPNTEFMEALWLYYEGLDESSKPTCSVCGKPLPFLKFTKGYKSFCSRECAWKGTREKAKKTMIERYGGVGYASPKTREKIISTNMERYGCKCGLQNVDVREKAKKTNLERYGATSPMQSEIVKEKTKRTMLERYGVEHALQSEQLFNKSKQTCKSHYGVEFPGMSEDVKEKIRKTNLERYGVEFPGMSEDVKEKIRKTNLERYGREYGFDYDKVRKTCVERYGVENPFASEEIKEKIQKTNLERYGVDNIFKNSGFKQYVHDICKQKFLETHQDIIDVEYIHNQQPIYIIKCHNSDRCNLCKEKCFKLTRNQYYNRISHNIELCPIKNPLCFSNNTSIEIFIKELLDKYNIEYKSNNRSIIGSKELDIYIPSKNLAIECNGCYWHSESKKPNNSYHIAKMRECEKRGIQLIQIWEDWIIHKPEIVKSLVLSKLGIYKDRIYARKCTLREVPMDECANFLENNHLQGSVNGSIRLGLYRDNDELVSIMVLGKKRKSVNGISSDDTYELYRYCNKKNTQVLGGASKLFTYFVKNYNPNQIDSFSSNDISNGSLYKMLGFTKEPKISRSYWYINSTMHRMHRFSFRKSELVKLGFDPSLSESQITESMGLLKIYDSGQSKWVWTNKNL